ncbi:MAG: hypothetical protein JWO13_1810 [Acidobacteriales bacterium]|nr:hypothetical protein [Terriglobales bacterium]
MSIVVRYPNPATLLYGLEIFAVGVCAVGGALAAARKKMDIFGLVVTAIVSAVGGGTVRDLLLDHRPVFWIANATFLWVSVVVALATAAYTRFRTVPTYSLTMADALGLALFTVSGAKLALQDGAPFLIAVLMATTTGVAGGAIRDVLCGEIPRIFRGEVYATVSLLGAALFVGMQRAGVTTAISAVVATAVIVTLRAAAIHWNVRLEPHALYQKAQ